MDKKALTETDIRTKFITPAILARWDVMTQVLEEQIEFPLPPLAEQRRIVTKVDQLMAIVDELETQLAASHTTAAKLLNAIVAEMTA